MGPFSSITYICEIMIESRDQISEALLKKNFGIMKNASRIASLKTKTLLDLSMILSKTFRTHMTLFEPYELACDLAEVMDQHKTSKQVNVNIKRSQFSIFAD